MTGFGATSGHEGDTAGEANRAFGRQTENGRSRAVSCNLSREWRSLEKETQKFLFESTVTH